MYFRNATFVIQTVMLSLALVVLKDKVSVLGPGLGLETTVPVNITHFCTQFFTGVVGYQPMMQLVASRTCPMHVLN